MEGFFSFQTFHMCMHSVMHLGSHDGLAELHVCTHRCGPFRGSLDSTIWGPIHYITSSLECT